MMTHIALGIFLQRSFAYTAKKEFLSLGYHSDSQQTPALSHSLLWPFCDFWWLHNTLCVDLM